MVSSVPLAATIADGGTSRICLEDLGGGVAPILSLALRISIPIRDLVDQLAEFQRLVESVELKPQVHVAHFAQHTAGAAASLAAAELAPAAAAAVQPQMPAAQAQTPVLERPLLATPPPQPTAPAAQGGCSLVAQPAPALQPPAPVERPRPMDVETPAQDLAQGHEANRERTAWSAQNAWVPSDDACLRTHAPRAWRTPPLRRRREARALAVRPVQESSAPAAHPFARSSAAGGAPIAWPAGTASPLPGAPPGEEPRRILGGSDEPEGGSSGASMVWFIMQPRENNVGDGELNQHSESCIFRAKGCVRPLGHPGFCRDAEWKLLIT